MATSLGWGAGINFRLVPSTTLNISSVTGRRGVRGEGCLPVELSVGLSRFSLCWLLFGDCSGEDDDEEDTEIEEERAIERLENQNFDHPDEHGVDWSNSFQ